MPSFSRGRHHRVPSVVDQLRVAVGARTENEGRRGFGLLLHGARLAPRPRPVQCLGTTFFFKAAAQRGSR
jgi:hypothetical protein